MTDHKAAHAFALGKDYSPNPAVKNLAACYIEQAAQLETERKRKGYLSAAFGSLCDEHFNDDVPTTCVFCDLEAERKAREEANRVVQYNHDIAQAWYDKLRVAEVKLATDQAETIFCGAINQPAGGQTQSLGEEDVPSEQPAALCPGCGGVNDHDMYQCVQNHTEQPLGMAPNAVQEPVSAGSRVPPFTPSPAAAHNHSSRHYQRTCPACNPAEKRTPK